MSNTIVKSEAVRLDAENAVDIEAAAPKIPAPGNRPGEMSGTSEAAQSAARASILTPDESEPDPEALIQKAKAEAGDIIKRAQLGAQAIISEAEAKAKTERERVYEQSKTEGYQAGYQKGLSETEEIRKSAKAELDGAVEEKNRLIGQAEGEIVDMIVRISEKFVGNAAAINPGVVQNLVRQGFSGVSAPGDVTVRVSPADYQGVAANRELVIPPEVSASKVEFRSDEAMRQGECVIETVLGDIDCGLGQQFEGLRNDLYYIMNTAG
ncbi:MAG: FliH/SctL family protein [Firmicutes bacterium]|nr:FliH/SctL family protein [Bacillota bacterium]